MNIIPVSKKSLTYKLTSKDPNNHYCYIGSTTNFRDRINSHRYRCRHNLLPHIYKVLGNDFDFQVIEEFEGIDKHELHKHERKLLEQTENTVNLKIPSRTKQEWRKANLDAYNKKRREHYQRNREKLLKQKKKWYHQNKAKLLELKTNININDQLTVQFE